MCITAILGLGHKRTIILMFWHKIKNAKGQFYYLRFKVIIIRIQSAQISQNLPTRFFHIYHIKFTLCTAISNFTSITLIDSAYTGEYIKYLGKTWYIDYFYWNLRFSTDFIPNLLICPKTPTKDFLSEFKLTIFEFHEHIKDRFIFWKNRILIVFFKNIRAFCPREMRKQNSSE